MGYKSANEYYKHLKTDDSPLKHLDNYASTIAEFTGYPAAARIVRNPKETTKGVWNTINDVSVSAGQATGVLGQSESNINPMTGEEYWSGVDRTMDVAGVLPYLGTAGKLAKTALKARKTGKVLKSVPKSRHNPVAPTKGKPDRKSVV